jgi:hypothetical protein
VAAAQQAPDPFAKRTEIVTGALQNIHERINEIGVIRADASAKGQVNRTACVASKLEKAKAALSSANTIMEGWSLGKDDPHYAERSTDRMLLMQLYATIALEEARACQEPKPQSGLEVVAPILPGETRYDPARPPRFERPPLASPY